MNDELKHKMFDGALVELGAKLDYVGQAAMMLSMVAFMQNESEVDKQWLKDAAEVVRGLQERLIARFGSPADVKRVYEECAALAQQISAEETPEPTLPKNGKVKVPSLDAGYL